MATTLLADQTTLHPPVTAAAVTTIPGTGMCIISSEIETADRQAVLDLFTRSSPDTRRDRFHHALSIFPQRYLEEILSGRQPAVVARDICHEDRRGQVLGLASAAPIAAGIAEFAVWVEDAWQGCGVGSLLARAILRLLADHGIGTAIGIMEPDNLAIRRLINRIAACGHPLRRRPDRRQHSAEGPGRRAGLQVLMTARAAPGLAQASPSSWAVRAWMAIVRRRRRIWITLGLAGLLFAAWTISGGRAELLASLSNLRRLSWIGLVPMAAAGCCAFTALAFAQRRILCAGGANVRTGSLARLAVVGQAVGSVLPVGYLFSGGVVPRVLARRGVSQLLVMWMLAMAGLLYLATLLLIGYRAPCSGSFCRDKVPRPQLAHRQMAR